MGELELERNQLSCKRRMTLREREKERKRERGREK